MKIIRYIEIMWIMFLRGLNPFGKAEQIEKLDLFTINQIKQLCDEGSSLHLYCDNILRERGWKE